jgi:putative endonuclease
MSPQPLRFVYIIRSIHEPAHHYVGLTDNVLARLAKHNDSGTAHTTRHRPWELVAAIEFADAAVAARFERYLKSGSGRAFAKRHFGAP